MIFLTKLVLIYLSHVINKILYADPIHYLSFHLTNKINIFT